MLVIEMVSRIHFTMNIKTSTFLLIFCFMAAGAGLATRGLLMNRKREREEKRTESKKKENALHDK